MVCLHCIISRWPLGNLADTTFHALIVHMQHRFDSGLRSNVAGFAAAGLWQHFRHRLGEEARLEAAEIMDFFASAGPNFGNICGDACKDALNIDGFELPEPFRSRWV